MYKQINNTCKITGCSNGTFELDYCHYHRSIIDRPCAYYYHKKLSIPVEWCGKYDKPLYTVKCPCKDKLEPILGIEIIERLCNLNQGG